MPRLVDVTAGRDNNVQALRVAGATAVIVFHCFALAEHWTAEPFHRHHRRLRGALAALSWHRLEQLAPALKSRFRVPQGLPS